MEFQQMSLSSHSVLKLGSEQTLEDTYEKIDYITQFASKAYYNKALKKLANDCPGNATIICDYIIAEQKEINIKQTTKEGKIKILIWLSNFHSGKSFKEMTKIDILNYLGTLRKTQVEDPYQRWVGSYNGRQMILVIPATAYSKITGLLSGTENEDQTLTTYLRSDERVGYNNALMMIVFYLSLLIGYALTFIYLVYWNKLRGYHIVVNAAYRDNTSTAANNEINSWKPLQARNSREILKYFTIFVLYIILILWSFLWYQDTIPEMAQVSKLGVAIFVESVLMY